VILDLYAGAGGWDEGARILDLPTVGLEIEHDPCVTAVRAGHPRIRCDVATYPTAPFAGLLTGMVASPPCQAWSMAGNRLGEIDRPRVHNLVNHYAAGHDDHGGDWADPRSHHAAQPVRWIRDLQPPFVCLEQVPSVIDLWRHIGEVLRRWGYAVTVQVLCAADYGVPQTRERAILLATRGRPAVMPEPTHEQNPSDSVLFGARRAWVSMAQALGWNGAFHHFRGSANWIAEHSNRRDRGTAEPASTITGEAYRWSLRNNTNENACVRPLSQPAGTLFFGQRLNNVSWVLTRPATTVQGDPRIGRPGHKNRDQGESQFEQDSLRVTITEAAILQSFPADYPWHGTKTGQFLQVGNAIPPRLAAAILGAATGIDWQPAVSEHYGDGQVAV
jgi:DNA (cytosine-5)-methyltransferase 1